MISIIRRLAKGEDEHDNNDNNIIQPAFRKKVYKKWMCGHCEHSFFYRVSRCPLCESDKIEGLVMECFGNPPQPGFREIA